MSCCYAVTQRFPLPHSHQDYHQLELTAGTSTLMVKAEEEAMRAAMMVSFMLMMFLELLLLNNCELSHHPFIFPDNSLTLTERTRLLVECRNYSYVELRVAFLDE
jgi:hypothetical protein